MHQLGGRDCKDEVHRSTCLQGYGTNDVHTPRENIEQEVDERERGNWKNGGNGRKIDRKERVNNLEKKGRRCLKGEQNKGKKW